MRPNSAMTHFASDIFAGNVSNMPISVECEKCGTGFLAAPSVAGRRVVCRSCGCVIQVPPLSDDADASETRTRAGSPKSEQATREKRSSQAPERMPESRRNAKHAPKRRPRTEDECNFEDLDLDDDQEAHKPHADEYEDYDDYDSVSPRRRSRTSSPKRNKSKRGRGWGWGRGFEVGLSAGIYAIGFLYSLFALGAVGLTLSDPSPQAALGSLCICGFTACFFVPHIVCWYVVRVLIALVFLINLLQTVPDFFVAVSAGFTPSPAGRFFGGVFITAILLGTYLELGKDRQRSFYGAN